MGHLKVTLEKGCGWDIIEERFVHTEEFLSLKGQLLLSQETQKQGLGTHYVNCTIYREYGVG